MTIGYEYRMKPNTANVLLKEELMEYMSWGQIQDFLFMGIVSHVKGKILLIKRSGEYGAKLIPCSYKCLYSFFATIIPEAELILQWC